MTGYGNLIKWIVVAAWLAAAVTAMPAVDAAAQDAMAQSGGETPISVTSDNMEADDQTKTVTFTGNVVGRREDVTLTCNVMRIYYLQVEDEGAAAPAGGEDEEGGRTEIDRVECEGEVKITQGDRVAMASRMIYYARATPRVIVMTGEPRIWRGEDFLVGAQITYFVDEDRSIVEGGDQTRVNAVFYESSFDDITEDAQ